MQIGPFGLPELLAILALALIIFGPRKLPELSRSLGRAIGEFRRGTVDLRRSLEDEVRTLDHEVRDEQAQADRETGPPPSARGALLEVEEPEEESDPGRTEGERP